MRPLTPGEVEKMTPREFVDEFYRRAKLEREIEAVDLELPLHMYLKVHKDEVAYCEEYSLSKWTIANGTSRIILTKEQNDVFREIEAAAAAEKQKELELNEAFDEIEKELEAKP